MSTAPISQPSESTQPAAAGGFGRLARRIAGWTANLLATAVILVAGLAVGRQVLVWRYEETPPPATAAIEGQLPPDLPQELRIWTVHGPLSIERVAGGREAAIASMRRSCGSANSGPAQAALAGSGEERFVARLAKLAPVEQTGDLNLYVPDEQLPMVVAVSREGRRIAAWSFGLEVEDGAWSCYTFCPK